MSYPYPKICFCGKPAVLFGRCRECLKEQYKICANEIKFYQTELVDNTEIIKSIKSDMYQINNVLNKTDDELKEQRIKTNRRQVCNLIKKHHIKMKDDSESLTTEFMKNIIGIDCDKSLE